MLRHAGLDPASAYFFKAGGPRIKSGVMLVERDSVLVQSPSPAKLVWSNFSLNVT